VDHHQERIVENELQRRKVVVLLEKLGQYCSGCLEVVVLASVEKVLRGRVKYSRAAMAVDWDSAVAGLKLVVEQMSLMAQKTVRIQVPASCHSAGRDDYLCYLAHLHLHLLLLSQHSLGY
jgi:hypothetical protein